MLAARALTDPGQVAWLALEGVGEGVPAGFDALWIALRLDWTQGELALVNALGGVCRVEVELPDEPARGELFAPLDPVHQELVQEGRVMVGAELAAPASPELAAVVRSLFGGPASGLASGVASDGQAQLSPQSRSPPSTLTSSPSSPRVRAISYGSPWDEARGVAREVRALLRAGTPPDAIAVALCGPTPPGGGIARVLPQALAAAGIPVAGPPGPLRAQAATQAALSVLALAEGGHPPVSACARCSRPRLLAVPRGAALGRACCGRQGVGISAAGALAAAAARLPRAGGGQGCARVVAPKAATESATPSLPSPRLAGEEVATGDAFLPRGCESWRWRQAPRLPRGCESGRWRQATLLPRDCESWRWR